MMHPEAMLRARRRPAGAPGVRASRRSGSNIEEETTVSRVRLSLAVAAVLALALSATVTADSGPKLHPSGFGEHSYASWKGGEGLPDSTGSKDQALYFQKDTATATFAAGVAVF